MDRLKPAYVKRPSSHLVKDDPELYRIIGVELLSENYEAKELIKAQSKQP